MFDCYEEQKALVKKLVGVSSVVGSAGREQAMAEYVYGMLSEWDYFRAHPEDLRLVPTQDDTVQRSSVVAVVRGCCGDGPCCSGDGSRESYSPSLMDREDASACHISGQPAVLLLGHIDTVETADYGSLEPLATKPDELEAAFMQQIEDLKKIGRSPKSIGLSAEFAEDLKSGRFMFGRGTLDMKAGVASHMFALRHFSENRQELNGSLIALFECDEEGDSHGIFSAVPVIREMAEDRHLYIKCAVCSDYSSQEKAVYLGTIGKYLPCVMAFGRSSHVGQVFSSMDPNLLISEITSAIDYNTEYSEENLGEITPPPVSLKQCDTKENYSVQTADSAYVYFNWFALRKTQAEVLEICKKEALAAAGRTVAKLNASKMAYSERIRALGRDPSADASLALWDDAPVRVYTLKEYAEMLGTQLRTPPADMDIRRFWTGEAARIRALDPDKSPVILVFMAGISYPPITVSPDSETAAAASKLGIPVRTYYPFISDVSFVSLLGDIPAVNLGTYGKDGHMMTERVDMEYSFGRLPNLNWELLKMLLI